MQKNTPSPLFVASFFAIALYSSALSNSLAQDVPRAHQVERWATPLAEHGLLEFDSSPTIQARPDLLDCSAVTSLPDKDQENQNQENQDRKNQDKKNKHAPRVPDDVSIQSNVVFGKGGDRNLTMHVLSPKKRSKNPAPVLVWIHGGGWQGGRKESGIYSMVPFVRQGFVSVTIEYRLTGEAPFPAQIEDCKCAIRYLRAHAEKYQIDPNRIAVGGGSAGGHLAALVGTSGGVDELEGSGGWPKQSSKVQAVVDLYGPTDFELFVTAKGYENHNRDGSAESKLLGGGKVLENKDGIRKVNPITYIDKDDPPFLIIHGSEDPVVPLNQSKALLNSLTKAKVDCKLHVIKGAKHGGRDFHTPEIRKMQVDFVSRVFNK